MRRLSPKRRKQVNLGFIAVILILGPVAIWQMFFVTSRSDAAWWNENFLYRQVADIANSNSTQLNDFQVALTVDTSALISAGKMQSNCNDIRITDQNGNLLPYWIEEGSADCNTSTTKIWTKVPEIATSGASLFFYYGNQQAQSEESGDQTFELFDDFNGSELNSTKWSESTIAATSGTAFSVGNGVLNGGNNNRFIRSNVTYTGDYTAEARSYTTTPNVNGFMTIGFFAATTNNFGILDHNSTSYYRDDSTWVNFAYNGTGQWTKNITKVVGTNATYVRTGETSGSSTATVTNSGLSGEYIRIGARYDNVAYNQNFVATWDWIIVRKAAATEPTVTMGSEESSPAPIHYYTFDEGTGNVASDSGALLRPGGLYNGPSWQMPSMCIAAGCIQLDGTNDFVEVNDPQLPTGDFTYSAWVNLQDVTDEMLFMASNNSGQNEMFVYVTSNKIQIFTNNVSRLITTTEITPNKWTYITVIRSGSIITVYFDGVADTSTGSDGTALNFDSCPLLIGTDADSGCNGGLSNYAQGRIDEVKIYPFALSSDQVKANYISQGGLDGSGAVLGAYDNENLSDGLIGYWKYDSASYNGTSGEVLDSSGNGYNGTSACSGASCAIESATSSAKFGNALAPRNNGTQTSYATVADGGSSDLLRLSGATNMTLSSWVYLTSLSAPSAGQSFVISKYTFSGSPAGYSLMVKSDGSIRFDINGSQNSKTTDTGVVSAGEWTHVAGVLKDGNTMQVFVNGVLVSTFPISQTSITAYTGSLAFGTPSNSVGSTQYTSNGSIDEARIYNRALDPLEIKQLYNFAPGPVGYYNFEEGQGSSVNDTSTYGHNGTWSGTGTKWDAGKYGKAANFNALDNFVTAGTYSDVNFSGSYSIGTWVNFRSYGDTRSNCGVKGGVIFSKQDSYYGLVMGINDSGPYGNRITFTYSKADLSATTYTYTPTISLNRWYYVTATHDKNTNTLSMYLDGSLAHSTTLSGDYLNPSGQVYFGGHNNNCSYQYPDGRVDEMKIYNYARTPAQIIQDMNAGLPAGGSSGRDAIGYWDFDEGYGTVIGSSGLTNISGAMGNTTRWVNDGKFGKAIKTDGSSTGDASIPDNDAIDFAYNQDFAVSFWVKNGGGNFNQAAIVEKWAGSGGYPYVFRYNNQNSISFVRYDGTNNPTLSGTLPINDGKWHYVVGLKQGSVLKLYIDNKLQNTTTDTTTGTTTNSSPVYLGARGGTTQLWNGYLDELKIYNIGLTEQDIQADMNQGSSLVLGSFGMSADGVASNAASAIYCVPGDTSQDCAPVAEWLFEEGRGGTANDTSTNNNNGTWNGTGSKWGIGKVGKGGVFNGTDNYVLVPYNSTLNPTAALSVSVWIKTSNGATQQIVGRYGSSPYPGYILTIAPGYSCGTTGQLGFWVGDNTNRYLCTTKRVDDGKWHYVVGTYDGTTARIYIDGVLEVSGARTNGLNNASSNLTIGRDTPSSTYYFRGDMDQVRVYNYALSPSQVSWEYSNGKPVAYYDFDECQGPTVHEYSGSGLDGIIQIGPSGTQTTVGTCQDSNSAAAWWNGRVGKYNYSLNFDGTDDFIELTTGSILPIYSATNPYSVSFWVKGGTNNNAYVYSEGISSSTSRYFAFRGEGTGKLNPTIRADNGVVVLDADSTSTVLDSTWHHVVWTDNAGSAKLYVDGKLDGTDFSYSASTATFNRSVVGALGRSSTVAFFNGQIDNVQMYNYELTPVQVRNAYNQGAAVRFGPLTGSP